MDNNQLWQAVLGELELTISKANFTTWFKGTYIIENTNKKIVVGVPNTFTKAWLEKKFKKNIFVILDKITSNEVREIDFLVAPKKGSQPQTTEEKIKEPIIQPTAPTPLPEAMKALKPFTLNDKYTFENFIVGKCNELANAAAKAVAEKPGHTYNPLFIYGGVGLGKTHLLQAIGNAIRNKIKDSKILYVSSEKFTTDFVKAIGSKRISQFKSLYRTVDILLMDDVQFLAGKEGTQEEFFHTFNELHQNNKQLVVTSDRPPKAIPALESRLLSRFEWGMIADISNIDFETRIAILQTKCEEKEISMDPDTIEYVARTVHNNVRELEGALNRIKAHIDLHKTAITKEIIKNILATITSIPRTDSLTPDKILKAIADFYTIEIKDLMGKSREKRLVYPRQIAMFIMREELRSSFPAIGKEIGGRDHTTAMHACQKIAQNLENDEKTRQDFNLIKQKLYA